MMADHVPFDIQKIIIKKLPAKSLIRFRCVSKQWKSLIDSSEFIKNYQSMNDPHLLVRYNVQQYNDDIDEYVSIIDNDTFPQHMSPITVPLSVQTLEHARMLCSRKSVSVLLEHRVRLGTGWVGFGVCPETCDPKLVKIDKVKGILEVHVYTLSTRAWKKVSVKSQYKSCRLKYHKGVCVKGFIYWLERDDRPPPFGNESYSIVSFNLSNDEFGKVCLPRSLQLSECLELSKWNECLTVIDHAEADIYDHSLNYWVMKGDGVAQSFTIMFHIEPMYPKYYNVFELRKNGEAIIETGCANNDPILQVYDPCSGHVNDIRIPWSGHDDIGETESFFSISSYMETLLLLDQ
ncbi:ribonuclease H-like domain-containing protein [Tanacetum coccineum]